MNGAREFATLFKTGQHGRLYLVCGSHGRGETFRIFVLPEAEVAKPNGPNPPLNSDAVEVYGITGGQPGWTETYGWLHKGPWQADFNALTDAARKEADESEATREQRKVQQAETAKQREKDLLAKY